MCDCLSRQDVAEIVEKAILDFASAQIRRGQYEAISARVLVGDREITNEH